MGNLLYHYTSTHALLEILRKRELWASDLRYSNDATENNFGRQEVADRLVIEAERIRRERPASPFPDEDPISGLSSEGSPDFWADLVLDIAARLRGGADAGSIGPVGACFTSLRDELSQWRGYGRGGCAIGVKRDTVGLVDSETGGPDAYRSEFASYLFCQFQDMQYGDPGIEWAVQAIAAIGWQKRSPQAAANPGQFANYAASYAEGLLSSLKHGGFHEEKETRLFVSVGARPTGSEPRLLRYRPTQTGLVVPYVAIPIKISAIEEIWVGPGVHQVDNLNALLKLRQTSQQNGKGLVAEIYPSDTPYK